MPTFEIVEKQTKLINADDTQYRTIITAKTPLPDPDTISEYVEEALRTGEIDVDGYDPVVDRVIVCQVNSDHLRVHVIVISDTE